MQSDPTIQDHIAFADSGFPRPMTLLELRWAGWLPKIEMNLADDEF